MTNERLHSHLTGLASADAKARGRAAVALRDAAIVEGELTDEAVAIAQLLIPIAGDGTHPSLPPVLQLLADLVACGEADRWLTLGYDVRGEFFEEAEPDHPARAIYEAAAAILAPLLGHLGSDRASVRAALGPLLAVLSRQCDRVHPALASHLPGEKDATAQGSLAIALALQSRYADDPGAGALLAPLRGAKKPAARIGGAVGEVLVAPADAPAEAVDGLMSAVASERKKVKDFPWFDGVLADLAVRVLAWLAEQRRDLDLAERLAIAAAGLPSSVFATGSVIDAAFPPEDAPLPRAPGELDEKQRRAALFLATSPDRERVASGLRRAGLSLHEAGLRRLAGELPPGPLARTVDGEPLLRTAARALRTAAGEARWHRALATLPEADRVEVARDALAVGLRVWDAPRPSDVDPERDELVVEERDEAAMRSRAVDVLSVDLATCSVTTLTGAIERLATEALVPPTLRAALVVAACEAAAREGVEVPLAVDAAFADINPGSGFGVGRLREALARIPPARREAIVLALRFWHADWQRPDVLTPGGAWAVVDLSPTPRVAEAVVREMVSWTGSGPYPEDLAVDILRGMGSAARPAIEAALAAESKQAPLLRRALAASS